MRMYVFNRDHMVESSSSAHKNYTCSYITECRLFDTHPECMTVGQAEEAGRYVGAIEVQFIEQEE